MSDEVLAVLRAPARLTALHALDLLDSPAEEAFDRLAVLASTVLRTPAANHVTIAVNDNATDGGIGPNPAKPSPRQGQRESHEPFVQGVFDACVAQLLPSASVN